MVHLVNLILTMYGNFYLHLISSLRKVIFKEYILYCRYGLCVLYFEHCINTDIDFVNKYIHIVNLVFVIPSSAKT